MKILTVKVKPNSQQQSIAEQPDGSLTLHLKSPPVDRTSQSRINHPVSEKV
jgi:uncharacterized protein YggU (UPF0235/DUF167 family)